jgi:hypothetical protein
MPLGTSLRPKPPKHAANPTVAAIFSTSSPHGTSSLHLGQQPPPPALYGQPPPQSQYTQRGSKSNQQQHNKTRGYGGNTRGYGGKAGGAGGYVPSQLGDNQPGGGCNMQKREPNPRKFHPNMLYCYSCGFDVDHDGNACRPHKQKEYHHHHANMTRQQARKWMKDDRFKGSQNGRH